LSSDSIAPGQPLGTLAWLPKAAVTGVGDTPWMPEESTTPDLVELGLDAFDAGGRHDLDAVMRFYAPDAVLDMSAVGLGTYEGSRAIREFVEGWWATFEDHVLEPEETVDLGHGVLFSKVREVGRLAGSDGRVEQHRGWVTVWVGNKIVHHAFYGDMDEARAAAERLAKERG
jgi:ketosteroid isomerase-like protein